MQTKGRIFSFLLFLLAGGMVVFSAHQAWSQSDQGTITGFVKDTSGAVIPSAQVMLHSIDTDLTLQGKTDGSGVYVFSPVKIGEYEVSATALGFETTSQTHLRLNIQQRLNVDIVLKPGAVAETVVVSDAPPLLESQSGSVGQVMSSETINNTPLNGRNWVYIAQLSAGVDPSLGSSRGSGTGDFIANGQRPTQNDFVLDGVDNNVNVDDFMNGASFAVRPPPDALAEFKIDTADYSAEFGHSSGGVLNASIKSGTNEIHGDFWEYIRNTNLDAQNWNATTNPPYHENQFGATLGFPIWRRKLFYFGDAEANRINYGQTVINTVPTALMRQGNFSEMLNPSLTGQPEAIQLYVPNSGGTTPLSCKNQNNVFCADEMDNVAAKIITMYPTPNANNGATWNNLVENVSDTDYTWQWDQRMDWNISKRDQAYARYSYQHEQLLSPPPMGPIIDGGGSAKANLAQSFMLSETHFFSPSLTNEFRFGYNLTHYSSLQPNFNEDVSPQLGLGGVPFTAGQDNGGLPQISINNMAMLGSRCCIPSFEGQNIYQILDNVTEIKGNHSLKFGVSLQSLRVLFFQVGNSRGQYQYSGIFTSDLGASYTGAGIADFLADQMYSASITPYSGTNYYRWYRSGYAQDDWRVSRKLTLNLGLRYDYFQTFTNKNGDMTNLVVTSKGIGTGTGILYVPSKLQGQSIFPPAFMSLLASQNVTMQYTNQLSIASVQKANFAPRIGIAYSVDPKTVVRGGFGLFYGGLESIGGTETTVNYPWSYGVGITAPNCAPGNCQAVNASLENGLSAQIAQGIDSFISLPSFATSDMSIKTPYTISYNLTLERALSNNLAATVGYVGNVGRHLETALSPNAPNALENPANNSQYAQPFPGFQGAWWAFVDASYSGESMYNALQAKLEKRYANGLNFLATYTWAHAMDDSYNTGGILNGVSNFRNPNLIPIQDEYTNSGFDVRQRVTLNGYYQLPFGKGRKYMNNGGWSDYVAGGWATSLTFTAQTGLPISVSPDNSGASGANAQNAILIGKPFAGGGNPDASNPGVTCPSHVKNTGNWYNPCAFANPLPGSNIPISGPGMYVTGTANAIAYLGGKSNQIPGPGYNRVNMSLFKSFRTVESQRVDLRVDSFNLLNHPSWSVCNSNNGPEGGNICQPLSLQNYTPDARFLQFSAKYVF
jgi:hypothetical protein